MTCATRPPAVSLSIPVGSPAASRTISPPFGSGVARVMPAFCKASELAPLEGESKRARETVRGGRRRGEAGFVQREGFGPVGVPVNGPEKEGVGGHPSGANSLALQKAG